MLVGVVILRANKRAFNDSYSIQQIRQEPGNSPVHFGQNVGACEFGNADQLANGNIKFVIVINCSIL